jgi:glycosyltransferase involved in cell wall biosynthesis
MDISIIMPVYNSELYLSEAIDSVLSQNYKSFELILVDDGSSDKSPGICDEYGAKYDNVRVIHKENGGICSARNAGLDAARGKYIGFCDNDDIYQPGLLRDNMKLAFSYDADVVRFSRRRTTTVDGRVVSQSSMTGYPNCYIPASCFAEKFDLINKTGEGIWAGIYRSEFLRENNIRFREDMRYGFEDLYFVTQIYACRPSVVLNKNVYYDWMFRMEHSTSGRMEKNNISALIWALELKQSMLESFDIAKKCDYLWAVELSERIFYVFKYIEPRKKGLSFKARMELVKYFADCKVFDKNNSRRIMAESRKSKNLSVICVNWMFLHRLYLPLYWIIARR